MSCGVRQGREGRSREGQGDTDGCCHVRWVVVVCGTGCGRDVVVVWRGVGVGGVLACRLMRESGSERERDEGAREINTRAGERAFS